MSIIEHFRDDYIEIKKSNIPGAGKGVFATKLIPKGSVMGYYKGKLYTQEQYEKLNNKDYIFELKFRNQPNFYIDASNSKYSNWTRYVNGARKKSQKDMINTDTYQQCFNIYFEAIKDIHPGEELIISYGRHYW